MLVNADVKGLEVVVAAELSGDEVLSDEILDRQDIHQNNQNAFKLPSRIVAKGFKFKLLYGATAYGFATDSDFTPTSTSKKFWQDVIDNYYSKYKGIKKWHDSLLRQAQETGKLEIPSGRFYPIIPDYSNWEPWPLTIIKNYPVQGFGADLVMLARLQARKLLRESGMEALMISTIHDSLVLDTPEKNVYNICTLLKQAIEDVPKLCKQVFDYEFKLPLTCELQAGPNKLEMKEIKL
jgi:DNA polymerase I